MGRRLFLLLLIFIPVLSFAQDQVGYLGVGTKELSPAMKKAIGVEYGVLVEKVVKDSPAEKGGLKTGDVIMEIDTEKIFDKRILTGLVENKPGKKVKLLILRNHHKKLLKITLGAIEKAAIKVEMNFPRIPDFNAILGRDTRELMKDMEAIKKELKEVKKEIEDLKKKMK